MPKSKDKGKPSPLFKRTAVKPKAKKKAKK